MCYVGPHRICTGSAASAEKAFQCNLAWTLFADSCQSCLVSPIYTRISTHSTIEEIWQERECRDMNICVSICLITSLGTSEISTHTATVLLLPFLRHSLWTSAGAVNSEWPAYACHSSKAVTVGHISHWPGRDVTHSNIPAIHHHAHARDKALLIAHPTHTNTSAMAALWDDPCLSVVKMCLSHGRLAKANKPATCQLTRAWTGSEGGLAGRCQEWQREGHGHAKKTSPARVSQPSHAGAQTCVLSCNSHPINPN